MDGQINLSEFMNDCVDYKIKRLIYSKSLTCYKTVCPYCHADNPDSRSRWEIRNLPTNICNCCGKKFDDVHLDVRKSKDYLECERLGLHGPVSKNEKGKWEEVKTDAQKPISYSDK